MRPPITFMYRNIVFGSSVDDAWAVYRLQMRSYAGLTSSGKRELLSLIGSCAYALEADFSLLRVSRPWSVEHYVAGVEAVVDHRHAHREQLDDYLDAQRDDLGWRAAATAEVYLSVRLGSTARRSPFVPFVAAAKRAIGWDDPRAIGAKRLGELLDQEAKVGNRIYDYLACEPASSSELQWLIRRSFSRAVADPPVERDFTPQALVVESADEEGEARFRPLEADVLRLMDTPINVERRSLRIETDAGESHQAFVCLGALPEVVPFPGRRAELLFAPLEALDFPVDAAFTARFVPNDEAVRLVRRRIVDADMMFAEESIGDHGPSALSASRPELVRVLEEHLTSADRPPLLRASISLAIGASSAEELEERVERVQREYGSVKLHRPLGEQIRLFVAHLPGQPSQVSDYDDYLTIDQFGAMVPVATHAVGSTVGPYIAHTLSGAGQPVLFDPTEASRTSRAPATLLAGTLGSGKTLCMELIMYQAFLAGSTICDIDPKGDHALERLPGVEGHLEVIELSPDERFRGLLDPLRIGSEDTREDLAYNFLVNLLPDPVPAAWQTELRLAVQVVAHGAARGCGHVIEQLERGSDDARDAARALHIHATSGLARLGFATADMTHPEPGARQITSLRIRNLTLPLPGTPRSEMLDEERIGQAVLHLLAVYALRLTTADPRRHSVLGFDEAWVLLADASGRSLVDRISRLGRAQNVTPLLATQMLGDVDELDGLIGAAFCFGVETEREARRALRLLGLDEDDDGLQQRLMAFRRGRCLMRDFEGRVSPVQIDLGDPRLLAALDTTPQRADDEEIALEVEDDDPWSDPWGNGPGPVLTGPGDDFDWDALDQRTEHGLDVLD
jgi:AAA-like domain